jgi:PKD repeat protein
MRGTRGVDTAFSNAVLRTTTDLVLSLDDLAAGDLVITEVLADPSAVTDAMGEWFELHNTRDVAVDLTGIRVEDLDGAGFTVPGPLVVPGGGYAVFAATADPALNGGVHADHTWSSFNLANVEDGLVVSYQGLVFDALTWDVDWPLAGGESLQLTSDLLDATSNDAAVAWCGSTETFGAGDLGTPGAANEACPNAAPTAVLTCPDRARRGEVLTFDALGSSDADGLALAYLFDFGDGATATGDLATHTYAEAGRKTVTLTVTDERGASATASCELEVGGALQPVVFDFPTVVEDYDQWSLRTLSFGGLPPSEGDVVFRWDFAACTWSYSGGSGTVSFYMDGGYTPIGSSYASSSSSCSTSPTEITLDADTYNEALQPNGSIGAQLYGRGSCPAGVGCWWFSEYRMSNFAFEIEISEPVAALDCPPQVSVGDSFDLDATGSFAGWDDLDAYSVSSNGIELGTDPVVSHAVAVAGDHVFDLTVTDSFGLTASTSCTVVVVP